MKAKPLDLHALVPVGLTVVEASAGTGKTHAIGTLALRAVLEWGCSLEQLLVATFTNAAAAELRGKLRERFAMALGQLDGAAGASDPIVTAILGRLTDRPAARARLAAALRDFDRASISTIHGFAARLLAEHAFDTGAVYDLELTGSASTAIAELVDEALVRALAEAKGAWAYHLARVTRDLGKLRNRLIKAAENMTRDPELLVDVVGGVTPLSVVYERGEALEDAVDALRRAWPADVAELERLLIGNPALNANRVRADSVREVLALFAAFVAAPRAVGAPLPSDFERLTQGWLDARIKKGQSAPRHAVFAAAQRCHELSQSLEAALELATHSFVRQVALELAEALPSRLLSRGMSSFDELVHTLHRAVGGPRAEALRAVVRARYPIVLIDEFQDTDHRQHEIFEQLFVAADSKAKPSAVFLIGDPKQSIYRFRGADVGAYLAARTSAGESVFTMTTNWRSDPRLLDCLNGLYEGAADPFCSAGISYQRVQPRPSARDVLSHAGEVASGLQVLVIPRPSGAPAARDGALNKETAHALTARATAAMVRSYLQDEWCLDEAEGQRRVAAHDLAVLVRTNRQGRAVLRALQRSRIPAVLQSAMSVFETPEAESLLTILGALVEPHRTRLVETALATELGGHTAAELVALRTSATALDEKLTAFHDAARLLAKAGPLAAFGALAQALQLEPRLLRMHGGERMLTNYWHLVELLHEHYASAHAGPEGLARWLARQLDGSASDAPAAAEAAQLRLESDAKAVRVVTVHAAKGLEYPIVLLPFLWAERDGGNNKDELYHRDADGKAVLAVGADTLAAAKRQREEAEESARLTYVALTRAKHRCVVLWGVFRGAASSPLRALLHPGAPTDPASDPVPRWTDAELRRDLEALAKRVPLLEVTDYSEERSSPVARTTPDAPLRVIAPRSFTRTLDRAYRTTSFSGLVGEGSKVMSLPSHAATRLGAADESAAIDDVMLAGAAGPGGAERRTESLLAPYPRGRLAGSALHGVFEKLDVERLARVDATPTEADHQAIASELGRYGVREAGAGATLAQALPLVARAKLHPARPGLSLGAIPKTERIPELAFFLAHEANVLTPRGLAGLLREHERAPWVEPYAERLERLGFLPMRGFVQGFIDLVLRHDGRFYVLDYKSNDLGRHVECYDAQLLTEAMMEHHYVLQALLYLAALHRYLRVREPGYRFAEHMGGALYLFVRGMAPQPTPGHGVFALEPSEALLEALADAALARGEAP